MQTTELDDLITEIVHNSPSPLDLDGLLHHLDQASQRDVITRAMWLAHDGLIDTLVEDGITFFIP